MESKPVRAQALFAKQMGLYGLRFEYVSLRMENNNYNPYVYLEEELELLQRTKHAILKSRLNAGILFVPEGLHFWNSEVEDGPEELLDALVDQSRMQSDFSFLPIIIFGEPDLLKEVRHLKFSDDRSIEVIQDRIDVIENRLSLRDRPVVQ